MDRLLYNSINLKLRAFYCYVDGVPLAINMWDGNLGNDIDTFKSISGIEEIGINYNISASFKGNVIYEVISNTPISCCKQLEFYCGSELEKIKPGLIFEDNNTGVLVYIDLTEVLPMVNSFSVNIKDGMTFKGSRDTWYLEISKGYIFIENTLFMNEEE